MFFSAFHSLSKFFPLFKVKFKYHLLQGVCPDYHPYVLIQEEVMALSFGLTSCSVSPSLIAKTEANYGFLGVC